jgi:nicotinate (nicotinamide) nucleotide adenylyltransferase
MQKIAIYGGTFNPIHNGHIHLAEQFALQLGVDRVLLIPTLSPPHKQAEDLASAQDRLAMCSLAAQDGAFTVSDVELRREGPSYTADTLTELKKQYPDSEFYLLMGEDMFLTVQNWYKTEVLYALSVLCAAPRSTGDVKRLSDHASFLERSGARAVVCNIEYLPVSSTMVRSAVKKGQSISGLVPSPVEDYIFEHHLYLECGR